MDYISKVNQAINFIEDNLKSELSVSLITKEVGFSLFHFHRVFLNITGCSMVEYVRKRRLSEAAGEILCSNKNILDIALEYQFNSPEAFTRAFTKTFCMSPQRFRKKGKHFHLLKIERLNDIKINHLYQGVTKTPSVKYIEGFKTVGIIYSTQTKDVPIHYADFRSKICTIENRINPCTTFGIIIPDINAAEKDDINYLASVQVDSFNSIPKFMTGYEVSSGYYAVFTHKVAVNKIMETYRYIYGTWLPRSKNELIIDAPNIEVYDDRYYNGSREIDIYIAIRK